MPENYSAKELDEQKEKIKADLLGAVTPSKNPQAYLLAGQPGAGECLYDREKTPFRDPSELFREEFSRDLTHHEHERIVRDCVPYVSRARVEETLHAYEQFFPKEEHGSFTENE